MTKTTTLIVAALAAALLLLAGCGSTDPADQAMNAFVRDSDRAAMNGDMATVFHGLTNGNEVAIEDALGKLSSDVDVALQDGITKDEIENFLTDNANRVQPFCDVCASELDRKRSNL